MLTGRPLGFACGSPQPTVGEVRLLSCSAIFQAIPSMIETNPILAQIADLKGRVESLRGYL
ncbi:hypothetical protein FHW84_003204 [Dyella sp. SG562]|nr:hypothetical protein [Dyella sp. SG562]NKJ20140.1 hypothetical protein [Dyella sp. SG609]